MKPKSGCYNFNVGVFTQGIEGSRIIIGVVTVSLFREGELVEVDRWVYQEDMSDVTVHGIPRHRF